MENYSISFSSGNISFEVSANEKEWIEEKIKKYEDFIDKILNSEIMNKTQETKKNVEKTKAPKEDVFSKMSINEFYRTYISAHKIKSRPDIATFFVFYLTKTSGKSEFNSSEIKELFKEIQYPNWNNINITDTLNQSKRRALLNNVNGLWALSLTGEDFVLNKLSNNE